MEWIKGPVGPGAERRVTRAGLKTVLVLVPHVVAGTRLVDVLPVLEGDHRVQVVFTVPDWDGTWHGTEEFVRGLGGVVLPWRQAVAERFDLVLAASHRGVDRVRGPVLVLPHGVGALKSRTRPWRSHGLAREALVRNGRVVAAAIVVAHEGELAVLRESCPEAVSAAVVGGDVCLDRTVASLPHRVHYRRALDVGRELITVCSTWTPQSVFGAHPEVFRRLLDERVDERTRVAAVLHPNTWAVAGAVVVGGLPARRAAAGPARGGVAGRGGGERRGAGRPRVDHAVRGGDRTADRAGPVPRRARGQSGRRAGPARDGARPLPAAAAAARRGARRARGARRVDHVPTGVGGGRSPVDDSPNAGSRRTGTTRGGRSGSTTPHPWVRDGNPCGSRTFARPRVLHDRRWAGLESPSSRCRFTNREGTVKRQATPTAHPVGPQIRR